MSKYAFRNGSQCMNDLWWADSETDLLVQLNLLAEGLKLMNICNKYVGIFTFREPQKSCWNIWCHQFQVPIPLSLKTSCWLTGPFWNLRWLLLINCLTGLRILLIVSRWVICLSSHIDLHWWFNTEHLNICCSGSNYDLCTLISALIMSSAY